MPEIMEKVFIIIISLVSAVVMGIMTWFSYKYLINAMDMGHMTPALRVPKWTFYVIIPIGFGLACIQYIRTVIKNFTEKKPWQSPDQQSEYEDEDIGGAAICTLFGISLGTMSFVWVSLHGNYFVRSLSVVCIYLYAGFCAETGNDNGTAGDYRRDTACACVCADVHSFGQHYYIR